MNDVHKESTFDPNLNIKREPELMIETILSAPPSEDEFEAKSEPCRSDMDRLSNDELSHHSESNSESYQREIEPSNINKKYKIDKKFSCEGCSKSYSTKSSLRCHKRICHNIKINPNPPKKHCKLCDKNVKNLDHHLSTFHSYQQFTCDKCSFSTKYSANLRTHQNSVHSKSKKFSCDFCSKKYSDQSNRNRHMNQAHRETSVRFECQFCPTSTSFGRQDNLKLHLKRIHGMDPNRVMTKLECDLCSTIFVTKVSLKKHMKNAHVNLINSRQKFKCSVCSKTFVMKQSLIDHLDSIHLRKFCCRNCCKVLGSEKTLKKHESRGKCRN